MKNISLLGTMLAIVLLSTVSYAQESLYLNKNGKTLRLLASNPNSEIGSSVGNITFWYSGVGYNKLTIGSLESNGSGVFKSNLDAIMTYQTSDNSWLYSQWKDKTGTRRAYMGLDKNLTNFRLTLQNGTSNFLFSGGNVGIGTVNPTEKLSVNGKIHTKEIKVDMIGWSDFVFETTYDLPTLKEVEKYIIDKGHLKDIPSATEVKQNGILLGEMNAKLLQKIEELTLYIIEQDKEMDIQREKIKNIERRNNVFQDIIKRLENLEKKE